MKLNNRIYDGMKFVALVLLPGFSAAYFSLAQIWHLPNAEQIVGTATVIDTFLGLLLKMSTTQYNRTDGAPDGNLIAQSDPTDGTKYLGLAINGSSVDDILAKDKVTLTVIDKTSADPVVQTPAVITDNTPTV